MNEVVENAPAMGAPTRYDENGMTEKQSYQPSRQECLRDYEVRIRFLTLGCIVSVGCKEIPFTTIKEGMEALNQYVAKPYEVRQIWEKRFQEEEK
ncbi:hypothetical protein UFOVP54_237 [uncultured Caudovirales phage]|uniref:Uncharacterized protein n=1 Tax=uncultured Caudovirales phage TaxID=2100421 RepID=A0A6J5KX39_9CAUD|nr:hypothetical protein UFOVP54_237 [uncultured Caudovirales phage]